MSDPENTARFSPRSTKLVAGPRNDAPDSGSIGTSAHDKPAAELTPKSSEADFEDKASTEEKATEDRISRRTREARLRSLHRKSEVDNEHAADGSPRNWRSAYQDRDRVPAELSSTADTTQIYGEGHDRLLEDRAGELTSRRSQTRLRGIPSLPAKFQEAAAKIPPLPQRGRVRSYITIFSFVLCVLLPTAVVGIYYLFYASNQYVSSFKFVVRDARTAAAGTTQAGGLTSLFGAGSSSNPLENYMVAEYITSRQAVEALQSKIGVMGLYSYADVDWVARFGKDQPIEKFMSYWQRMVSAGYDQITGIGTAQVRAFTPKDAYEIASMLVSLSEQLVNNIANKPQQDAIRFAEADLKRGEDRLKAIRQELNEFRNKEQVIDPQASVVTSNVLLAQTLRANISQLQTELSALAKQKLSPDAPASQALQSRIKATREQLAAVEGQVANGRDGSNSLSRVVAKFELLELERQFAQNMVQSLMQNLEQARAAALSQHVYVTAFVSPALPQSSTYPKRLLSIFVGAFIFFLFWVVGLLIVRSVREHLT